jgi:hypothetical protein
VWANRLRREVLDLCVKELQDIRDCEERQLARGRKAPPDELREEQTARGREQKFWCLATKSEAHFGLGELDAYDRTRSEAEGLNHAAWMIETFDHQISKLKGLLEKHGHLLNPPWPIAPRGSVMQT